MTKNLYFKKGHDHGQKNEVKNAKAMGAKLTMASGALGEKGDMVLGDFLIENKSTIHQSATLRWDWLQKVTKEAHTTGKTPALLLNFVDAQGDNKPFGSWVMMTAEALKEIVELLEDYRSVHMCAQNGGRDAEPR